MVAKYGEKGVNILGDKRESLTATGDNSALSGEELKKIMKETTPNKKATIMRGLAGSGSVSFIWKGNRGIQRTVARGKETSQEEGERGRRGGVSGLRKIRNDQFLPTQRWGKRETYRRT